ncbi:MAG: hypothetical protein A3E25_09520 [Burkholderiales bacterium RIFCSPHIGHO2_12_FULL_69_20]|nr:MAG: hypothetical protein A3E25_09520 [Burkholderiales bacterium RIFCSPHIGHO2_12_FULL_69_20]
MNPTLNRRLSGLKVLLTTVAALSLTPALAAPSPGLQGRDDAAPPKAGAASAGDPTPPRLRYGTGYESRFGWRAAGPSTTPGSGAGQAGSPSTPRGHGRGRGR